MSSSFSQPSARRALLTASLTLVSFATPGCKQGRELDQLSGNAVQQAPQADSATVLPAAPAAEPGGEGAGEWPMAPGDYASTRFSPLTQINASNVRNLKVAWTFSMASNRGQEAAPLIVGGTMYVVGPYPNNLYALDLTKPGAPPKWVFRPQPAAASQGVACCDVVNRGAAFADGRVFINTLDGQAIAVDAASGKEVWRAQLADINKGETITMAPLVVKGKVLVGNSGGEMGVRGWLTALDAGSGAIAWRAYGTGPDKDVLIDGRFKPFYPSERGKDLGVKTWPPDAWQQGGATAWGWISYDPELDLIYYGTANPGPWNADMRPGDNKWTATLFARDPDDGAAIWAYQWSPHDLWDHDGVNEQILLDLPVGGQNRKTLIHADRNGYFYVLDRTNGQVLSATPYVPITAYQGVDLKTGRIAPNQALTPKLGQVMRGVCPPSPGGKDWQPMAWSPRTRLAYIPHNNLCMDWESVEANYIAGTPYVGANVRYYAGPGGNRGLFTAWDPVRARPAWQIKENFMVWSGALATAGDVVFYGTMDGWFKAVDARNGQLLWQFKTGSGIIGQPVSYRGPDGKQYIAILSGIGGWPGAVVNAGLDTRDPTVAAGWGIMKDLKEATTAGGMLYVFALP